MSAPWRRLLFLMPLVLLLAGCGDDKEDYEITDVREVPTSPRQQDPHAGLFGEGGHPPVSPGLAWTAPEGWVGQPAKRMRVVTFRPSAESAAECYVTVLGPEAGDVTANMDRWREQMGQPRLDRAEFARLPRIQVLGQDIAVLQVEGSYRGDQDEQIAEAALLGIVCPDKDHSLFVKMIGPKAEVLAERANFEAFCRSLRRAK